MVYGKLFIVANEKRQRQAMRGYIQCEYEVARSDSERSLADRLDFQRVASLVFADCFTAMDRKIYAGEMVPKHGPGATADGYRANGKYRLREWPMRLEGVFSSSDYLIPNYSYWEMLDGVDFVEPGAERPVRVISVPKTMKTPRIIGIEPAAMQYTQQAVLPVVLEALREDDFLRSAIGFTDQVPNQELAKEGSLHGELATLDLSEASDRVSLQLVQDLFRNHAHLRSAVEACRSTRADVPGEGVISLSKFASMGSALCFPVEAMVFLTCVLVGIERGLGTPLTPNLLWELRGKVRVYGDDLIVPVDSVRHVVEALELFGAKVNSHKSFWTGKFRESCGKDFYDGEDVTVVRFRQRFPTQREDATGVISLVSFRNQCYSAGYWQTCRWLDVQIGRLLKRYPMVLPTSPVLGRHSFLGYQAERERAGRYQIPLVKGWIIRAVAPSDPLDGHAALLKVLLSGARRGDEVHDQWGVKTPSAVLDELFPPGAAEDHLQRSGRPLAVDIKLAWASAV